FFFFSSRRRHTRCYRDWSSDVCSSDLRPAAHQQSRAPNFPLSSRVGPGGGDRKSVVWGKSVDLGGRRIIKKKKKNQKKKKKAHNTQHHNNTTHKNKQTTN